MKIVLDTTQKPFVRADQTGGWDESILYSAFNERISHASFGYLCVVK